jgi:hypothetical protein
VDECRDELGSETEGESEAEEAKPIYTCAENTDDLKYLCRNTAALNTGKIPAQEFCLDNSDITSGGPLCCPKKASAGGDQNAQVRGRRNQTTLHSDVDGQRSLIGNSLRAGYGARKEHKSTRGHDGHIRQHSSDMERPVVKRRY